MGKKGGGDPQVVTQQTDTSPWESQQPYLEDIFGEAQNLYQSDIPEYFQDSTVVPFSPQTEQALRMTENRALAGSPLQTAGNQAMMDTVSGSFLQANNPYLQSAFNAAARPMTQQFMQEVAPGIDSAFSKAGRYGSNIYAQTRNRAEDTLANSLSDLAGRMAYQNYSTERGLQNQAAMMAPQYAQADYMDALQLANVGASRESLANAELQDRLARWNFEQNKPYDKLAKYSGLVSGGYGSSQNQQTPYFYNPASSFLSGGMGGAGLASMMGINPLYGGIAGGLLGLL